MSEEIDGFAFPGDLLPPGMKEALDQVMKKIKARHEGHSGDGDVPSDCYKGTCACQQVARLTGEALLSFKTSLANQNKMNRKGTLLVSQLELLKKQLDMERTKNWEMIYTQCEGLNTDMDLHFCEDGRIMKRRGGNS